MLYNGDLDSIRLQPNKVRTSIELLLGEVLGSLGKHVWEAGPRTTWILCSRKADLSVDSLVTRIRLNTDSAS